MRIISGQRRGHKIEGPRDRATRATSDMVRESIFNILREDVEDRTVIDLFAGTGALGLEALSRGAARAIFVERDRENVAIIRRNLATLRYEDRGTTLPTDGYRWARSFEPMPGESLLIFLDPPYRDFVRNARRARELLGDLVKKLPADAVVVVQMSTDADLDILPEPDAWDLRRYGTTRVAVRTVGSEAQGNEAADDTGESDVLQDSEHPDPRSGR